ncbi:MAG: diguanylate cyclase (GGDEF)-like protein/PAS domain S-box-containing protein [Desulforhopalus sp.]
MRTNQEGEHSSLTKKRTPIKLPQFISNIFAEKTGRFRQTEGEARFFQYTVFLLAAFITTLPFGLFHLFYGNIGISINIVGLCLFLSFGWVLLYHGLFENVVYRVNTSLFFCFLVYLMILGTDQNSMMLWMYIFPTIVFYLLGQKEGVVWTLVMVGFIVVFFFGPFDLETAKGYSSFFVIRFLIVFIILSAVTYAYERFRSNYKNDLEGKNLKLIEQIQERENAERSLTDRELRYEAIYLGAVEGILLIDNYGDIIECNPQILTMLGYAEKDLVGKNVSSLVHEDDLKILPLQLDKLHSGKTIQVERRLQTVSGIYLLCEVSGKRLQDNLVILLYRDITERKIAEMALERANLALDKLAHIDGLTQVANRRRFDKVLEDEWLRMYREKKCLGLILADVDFFKQFNDLYGHQVGDDCLVSIATALNSVIHRPGDLVARYGGEEFVIVLPDTNLEGCLKIARIMKEKIELLKIEHTNSSVSSYVTISLGVAVLSPDKTDNRADLIGRADKALYRAKEEGRNRVC